MKGYSAFDPLDTPLEGANLIEASAGTGKTYAITGLFLRLLLEKDLAVHQILVVTFTEAATDELKDRIRSKIREAIGAFQDGRSEDSLIQKLVKKHPSRPKALSTLREALRSFDEAAIFTIHGFCRRTLHENAFESGSLFDTELVTDPSDILQENVEDFWRRHLYEASPLFVNYALDKKFTLSDLYVLLSLKIKQPLLKIIPGLAEVDTNPKEKAFRQGFSLIREAWPSATVEVREILTSYEGLNKAKYKPSSAELWIEEMNDLVEYGENRPGLFPEFKRFSRGEIEKGTKKGYSPPSHSFFDLCENLLRTREELAQVFERRLLHLKALLISEAEKDLSARKMQKNIQTFDDLLLSLQMALAGRGGTDLSLAVTRKYKAALIDEFQDTDPVQYFIFRSIFDREGSTLFLVGDPKQAIYGFRGADIFAYMEAAEKIHTRYTLTKNWRSEPRLIKAVNTLFSNSELPFVYEKIGFQPAFAAEKKEPEIFKIDGNQDPALQIWYMDPEKWAGQEGVINKGVALAEIPGLVASEICRLLNLGQEGKAHIGERTLRAQDIAVLVRTNDEAQLLQKALSMWHIPGVLYSTQNLFDSHEALEMERVLCAVVEPNNESLVKAALVSDMIGMTGDELDELIRKEAKWEAWLVKFRRYHELWSERGFMPMFRSFLRQEEVLKRLVRFPDGERRNTNVLHLMEVLHQASMERRFNMTGLQKWLSGQRDPMAPRLEEYQLRLESDENAVNLVTVHKSKGLEYPIVFCPFSWEGLSSKKGREPFVFHDAQQRMQLTLDLGSEKAGENRVAAEKEALAENLRLFYVALTRAKCRLYLIWGRFRNAETSGPGYLLHPPSQEEIDSGAKAMGQRFNAFSNDDLFSTLKRLTKQAGARVSIIKDSAVVEERFSPLPEDMKIDRPRRFSAQVDGHWKISSFSSLVSQRLHSEEVQDVDTLSTGRGEDSLGQPELEKPSGFFAFPRGAKAGTFLHDLFEHLDFQDPSIGSRQALVTEKLEQYGYDLSWRDDISRMVERVLYHPLASDRRDFCFSRVPNESRLNELEFYFPLKSLTPEAMKKILRKGSLDPDVPDRIDRLDFAPLRGFMKGFMDMVFRFEDRYYLVDWKSNFLGPGVEDYGPENLGRAMDENFYTLQYHLYTIALHQYLKLRVPEYNYQSHFGGVFYVFLRGVEPEKGPDFGIYRDRVPAHLVDELTRELIGAD